VVEILIYLMQEIRENQHGMEHIDGISKDLVQQGYTENEINAAFSWLFERFESDTEKIYASKKDFHLQSYRVLHDIEKLVISPEAYGYILQLQRLNLIGKSDVEQIIDRALMLGGGRVGVDDIKSIVASMFFNSSDLDHNYIGKSMLDMDGVIH